MLALTGSDLLDTVQLNIALKFVNTTLTTDVCASPQSFHSPHVHRTFSIYRKVFINILYICVVARFQCYMFALTCCVRYVQEEIRNLFFLTTALFFQSRVDYESKIPAENVIVDLLVIQNN